jgi:hypothetical protein
MPLLHLPREIRDDIFINVLSSYTGHIHISLGQNSTSATFSLLEVLPSTEDVKGQITLPILRVSKQIHSECNNLLWKHNTFFFYPDSIFRDLKYLDIKLAAKIQHVQLVMDLLSLEKWNEMALSKLGSWARSGALKSVTLKLVDPILASVLHTSSVWTKAIEEKLALLRKVGGESGSLSGVKRRVEINTRLECTLVEYAQRMSEYKGLDAFLKNVQDAFDGELWVDGILKT